MKMYLKVVFVFAMALSSQLGFSQSESYAKPVWGTYTDKDGFVYAHITSWPKDGKIVLDRNMKPREARFVSDLSKKVKIKLLNDQLTVLLPKEAPKTETPTLRIQLTPNEDWANFNRYRKANSALETPSTRANRVVFMGNSITDKWAKFQPEFFEENNYVGRGISGQTTSQMLLRFKQDVINLQPKAVVIHAGTNDIAGNRGPITVPQIAENIFSMAELARVHNIKVVLASVLPASSYSWSPAINPVEKIVELNNLIKLYAVENNIVYLDYYAAMVNDEKALIKKYGRDTVHPNIAGYEVMKPLVKKAITEALK